MEEASNLTRRHSEAVVSLLIGSRLPLLRLILHLLSGQSTETVFLR